MAVIRRLPRYFRFLSLLETHGITRISSKSLAERMNVNASQIRQDFNCFGDFGQQGYGYVVNQLKDSTADILGLKNTYSAIIVGAGNLGKAIASHMIFEEFGFTLAGIFDNSENLIGSKIKNNLVRSTNELESFCNENHPVMAVLCIPNEAVPGTVKKLYDLGVRNFWNFSHHDIAMDYKDVIVENVHMNDSLMTLCYRISHKDD